MLTYYKHTCEKVNKSICLTDAFMLGNFVLMKYGERLKLARIHAGLTQKELVDRMGNIVSQQNISLLEKGDATGSEFTVQIASVCGVRPEWLAMEQGPMVSILYSSNEKITHAMKLMESMPEYALDEVIKSVASIKELIEMAETNKTKTQ